MTMPRKVEKALEVEVINKVPVKVDDELIDTLREEELEVEDVTATDYLRLILAELKVTNLHLAAITGKQIEIDEEDI